MTPPSNAVFLESYPEFNKAPSALLTRKLLEASRRTNDSVYADDATAVDACCLKAAVLMTLSPQARAMKLVDDTQAMIWAQQLYELQRSATMGTRVFG